MPSLTSIKFTFLILFISLLLSACGSGGNSSNAKPPTNNDKNTFSSTAVFTSNLQSSALCPSGGIEIHSGIDVNQNGLLDEDEINNTQELCHADSSQILTSVEVLELDSECLYGGNKLRIGYDEDSNGLLENSEVIQTNLFCAQQQTINLALLVYKSVFIEPGEMCSAGGRKISSGIDLNANQVLDLDEVSDVQYYCDYDGPIRPYEYSGACDNTSCDLIEAGSAKVIVPEVNESTYIGKVFDDGFGLVTLTADASLPSWLSVELSEFAKSYYYNQGFYSIIAAATNIPSEAFGQTFDSKVNVTDGQRSFDIAFSIKVVEPIRISLDTTEFDVVEPSSDENAVHFIKVTFDKPLPNTLISESSSSYGGTTYYMLDVLFEEDGEEVNRSNDNSDFSVEWIGNSLFRGQTEGTIMLTIKDDHLPEDIENYTIVVGQNSYQASKGVVFKPERISLQLTDDGDLPIIGTLALDRESVNESTTSENPEELGFTINFDKPLPSDASLTLRLRPTDNSYALEGKDVGFNERCSVSSHYTYYCDDYMTISLLKGQSEYNGSIKVKPDVLKEGDEVFSLLVEQSSIGFIMAGLESSFTVIDDDQTPAINFVDKKVETYYTTSVINIPLKLTNPSIDDVALSFSVGEGGSLIEGTHFDFAVSFPMVFSGRADELYLPIIIYQSEFDADFLSTTIHVNAVEGAINGNSTSLELVLDKISSLYINASSLNIPVTQGAYLYGNHLVVSEDGYIYKLGEIRDGNVIGQDVVGDRDIFVAKFNTQGGLIWARQFGTTSWDSLSSSSVSSINNDNGILVRSNKDFYISEFGEVTPLSDLISGYVLNVSDLQKDSEGNIFLLATKGYYYDDGDLDRDGSTSDFIVAKYDSEWNQQWFTEDFTDIEPGHSDFDFNVRFLKVTKSGIPYILGNAYQSNIDRIFSSISGLGGDDLMLASFNTIDGSTRSLQNFGSDQNDSSSYVHFQPIEEDQLIGFYRVLAGAVVDGETVSSSGSVRVLVDSEGVLSQELYKFEGEDRFVESLVKGSNGYFFMIDVHPLSSNVKNYSILDKEFNQESSITESGYSSSGMASYFRHTPAYLEDGAYLVTNTDHVTKLTSTIKTRSSN
ncbi:MAG: hypothetical protein ACMZ64_04095 [Oleiphilus sp.]